MLEKRSSEENVGIVILNTTLQSILNFLKYAFSTYVAHIQRDINIQYVQLVY